MVAFRRSLPLVSAFALAVAATSARAADPYAPVPAANWAGFYAGSLIGYGLADVEVNLAGGGPPPGSETFDGATAGAVIGHNWQSGAWVFGVEGDITLHEIRGTVADAFTDIDVDTLYSAHLRARAGYDMGRFLPYVAAGFTANETYTKLFGAPVGDNRWMHGWNVGAGIDWKLGETFIGPLIVRAEYLYEHLPEETFNLGGTMTDVEHGTHFVRLGLISYAGAEGSLGSPSGDVDWSGAYGGVMLGFTRHNVETSAGGSTWDMDSDGVLGGIYTGRNFQFGNVVAGWEGSVALTDVEGTGSYVGFASDYRANIQTDLRARLGYAFGEVLPFVSAGVLWTRSEQRLILGGSPHDGRIPALAWTVGAGVDYRLNEDWSVRGEYLYAKDSDADTLNIGAGETQEIEIHQVRFGTAYHF